MKGFWSQKQPKQQTREGVKENPLCSALLARQLHTKVWLNYSVSWQAQKRQTHINRTSIKNCELHLPHIHSCKIQWDVTETKCTVELCKRRSGAKPKAKRQKPHCWLNFCNLLPPIKLCVSKLEFRKVICDTKKVWFQNISFMFCENHLYFKIFSNLVKHPLCGNGQPKQTCLEFGILQSIFPGNRNCHLSGPTQRIHIF